MASGVTTIYLYMCACGCYLRAVYGYSGVLSHTYNLYTYTHNYVHSYVSSIIHHVCVPPLSLMDGCCLQAIESD